MELRLFDPPFGSKLVDFIIDLDHLRRRTFYGTTMPWTFSQIKHIFHLVESIGSARIEGNNTTLAEYIETRFTEPRTARPPGIIEIDNMEKALAFIDENATRTIDRAYLSELHKITVDRLPPPPEGEGDQTPGVYRAHPVRIEGSGHKPPATSHEVNDHMQALIDFIRRDDPPKYDLLKTAIAHHRFMWIHPFGNGNGRTGRLMTYAMLVGQGFAINKDRIVNPTAVFCIDRNKYYDFLEKADKGTQDGLEVWCEYMLGGLKTEFQKIDRLLDHDYLVNEIVVPALRESLDRGVISDQEFRILETAIRMPDQLIQATDVKELIPGRRNEYISRLIRGLRKKKMLATRNPGERKYYIRFDNNFLLRSIIGKLGEKGFLSVRD